MFQQLSHRDENTQKFDCFETFQDQLLFLQKLVSINSQTKNSEGVNQVQYIIKRELELLDFHVSLISNPTHHSGHLLSAIKPGKTKRKVIFVCHADTVTQASRDYNFEIKENRVYGPGVADDKAGIATILFALKENINEEYTLQVICSPNEEKGSLGFHQFFEDQVSDGDIVLGFEPAKADGTIISSRNGNRWYKLKIKGKAAHSGRFEPHLNAAHELAHIITEIHQLNDLDNGVKANIGSIKTATDHYNVVCGEIEAKLDIRFPCFNSKDSMHNSIEALLNQKFTKCHYTENQCEITYDIVDDCPPLPLKKDHCPFLEGYLTIIESIENKKASASHSGGAADINYFCHKDVIAIDGLGPVGGKMHTKEEYIELETLKTRTRALIKFLDSI